MQFYHMCRFVYPPQYCIVGQSIQKEQNVQGIFIYTLDTYATATAAKSLQSCLTLCDPIPGILQARTLEWVAISFSNT